MSYSPKEQDESDTTERLSVHARTDTLTNTRAPQRCRLFYRCYHCEKVCSSQRSHREIMRIFILQVRKPRLPVVECGCQAPKQDRSGSQV